MIESEYKEGNSEVIDAYYDIYLYNLNEGLIDVEDAEDILQELEDAEYYLECAGVFKAINNYKAVKDERFSDLWIDINTNTD